MIDKQLLLDLKFKKLYDWKNFYVSTSNSEAVFYLQNFLSMNNNILWISGPTKCGKSHLAGLWRESTNAYYIASENDSIFTLQPSSKIQPQSFFIIDDSKIISQYQDWFFHFFNASITYRTSKILVLSESSINNSLITLKDLKSRLLTGIECSINMPDDVLLTKIIRKAFFEYGFNYREEDVRYILKHSGRSYMEIFNLLELIYLDYSSNNSNSLRRVVHQNVPSA